MVAVALKDISLRYSRQWTLLRISAEFPEGKSTLITGDNGAGKTTLLRIVATALRPTRGQVEIFGQDALKERESVRAQLGMISHNSHLYYDLSALENLKLVSEFSGAGGSAPDPGAALERVGLQDAAHQAVRNFSAGMKRRVVIARMLLRHPDLVLLDEPFGQLDVSGVDLMADIIGELHQRGATVIVATHNHALGRSLCELHVDMVGGRILEEPAETAA